MNSFRKEENSVAKSHTWDQKKYVGVSSSRTFRHLSIKSQLGFLSILFFT